MERGLKSLEGEGTGLLPLNSRLQPVVLNRREENDFLR